MPKIYRRIQCVERPPRKNMFTINLPEDQLELADMHRGTQCTVVCVTKGLLEVRKVNP